MAQHFERRVLGEEILVSGELFRPVRHCGVPPALGDWRRTSTRAGHEPVQGEESPNGRFICYRRGGWAAVEWTDRDHDVYSVAYGPDMGRLYDWWKRRAGPLPAD